MANLNYIEKQYIEKLFGMQGGYVLDFSNRTFSEFIFASININIYDKYPELSKAKILREILIECDDKVVGKLLLALLDYKRCCCKINDGEREMFLKCVDIGHRLIGKTTKIPTSSQNKDGEAQKIVSFNFDVYKEKIYALIKINNAQQRGYAFEKYLNEYFDENGLAPRASFKIIGEQIDGSFLLDGETYLIEAKWQNKLTTKNDLILFQDKVSNKSDYTRGLFISYSGYTDNAVEAFMKGKSSRIIIMDGRELMCLLESNQDLKERLRYKQRTLAETGNCYSKL